MIPRKKSNRSDKRFGFKPVLSLSCRKHDRLQHTEHARRAAQQLQTPNPGVTQEISESCYKHCKALTVYTSLILIKEIMLKAHSLCVRKSVTWD